MAEQKDTYELLQYGMINTHNTLKVGYDRIVELLDNVPRDDMPNFLGYCEAWAINLTSHHDVEETIIFPFLNTKMDFSEEQKQHEVIHSTLEKVYEMIRAAKEDHSKFNVDEMKELMVDFREPLFSHLDGEVDHIAAGSLKAAGFTEDEVKGTLANMHTYIRSHGDAFMQLPYMRSHIPPELKDVWPPLPWVLKKVVVPYVLARRYSGYWKYSPYAMS